jgi:hypothetical protein
MNKASSVLSFLLAVSVLPAGLALSQETGLRPLPIATTSLLPETVTAMRTDQSDLQRLGFILKDRERDTRTGESRGRLYTFERPSGSSQRSSTMSIPRTSSTSENWCLT